MIKGPDIFLAVVSKLAKEYDNLFVVLTGPARGYVKQGLRKLRIPFIHDYLSDYYDIVPYYQILDLYIIASRCEGGPKSLLESWATGVPVVSTRVGMSADIINHEGNGMLAEVEDVESLTIHAKDILERTGLRERCRNQALKEVRDYDWPLIAKRYFLELYQPVLQQE
jgi:glycosyltransferase involved in cell wall biosynthesis